MKLRFLVLRDMFGSKSAPILQYWDDEYRLWIDVEYVECKIQEYDPEEE